MPGTSLRRGQTKPALEGHYSLVNGTVSENLFFRASRFVSWSFQPQQTKDHNFWMWISGTSGGVATVEPKLAAAQMVCCIDNNSVRDATISCSTSNKVGEIILSKCLEIEDKFQLQSWSARVSPPSNLSDWPSKGSSAELQKLGCKPAQVDVNNVLAQINLWLHGRKPGMIVPNCWAKKKCCANGFDWNR